MPELTERDLATVMLGRVLGEVASGGGHAADGTVLEVEGVVSARLDGVDLRVRTGEIVGVTGLADSGYHELPYVLAGAERAPAGRVSIGGAPIDLQRLDPAAALAAGVALVPADREHAGLALELSVIENAAVPGTATRAGRLKPVPRRDERAGLDPWLDRLQLRPRDPAVVVGTLSGGNQQKVVLAKWLARSPRLLVLHEPTQAVDVGAREIIVGAVKDAAAAGCGVLVASGDENELSMLCDRVIVFRDGRVAEELAGPQAPDDIVSAVFANAERRPLRAPIAS